jgi:hypothetical protein
MPSRTKKSIYSACLHRVLLSLGISLLKTCLSNLRKYFILWWFILGKSYVTFFCVTTGASAEAIHTSLPPTVRVHAFLLSYSSWLTSKLFPGAWLASSTYTYFYLLGQLIPIFSYPLPLTWSRGSSIGIATSYGLDGRGSILGKSKRFLLLHNIQSGSLAHQPASPMGTGALFPRLRRPGREDNSLLSSA